MYVPLDIPSQASNHNIATMPEADGLRKPGLGSTMIVTSHEQQARLVSDQLRYESGPWHHTPRNDHLDESDRLLGHCDEPLPEEIVTSLYMQQVSADFTIVIRPPSLEYSIPSKNFLFVKTLTREENQDFIANKFADWHNQAIACLSKYNKFVELLAIMDRGIDYKSYCARQEAETY